MKGHSKNLCTANCTISTTMTIPSVNFLRKPTPLYLLKATALWSTAHFESCLLHRLVPHYPPFKNHKPRGNLAWHEDVNLSSKLKKLVRSGQDEPNECHWNRIVGFNDISSIDPVKQACSSHKLSIAPNIGKRGVGGDCWSFSSLRNWILERLF